MKQKVRINVVLAGLLCEPPSDGFASADECFDECPAVRNAVVLGLRGWETEFLFLLRFFLLIKAINNIMKFSFLLV